MPLFDVIIPVGKNDINFLPRVVNHLLRCISDIQNIYIISANRNISVLQKKLKPYEICKFLDEDGLLPIISFERVKALLEKYAPERVNRTGWYLQQFLKMGFSRTSYCRDYYLSWDGDTLSLAPITYFDGNNILYNPKVEYNHNYFVSAQKLTGIGKVSESSFISESMMFSSKIMGDLLDRIDASEVTGGDWVEKIIAAGDYSNPLPAFSEFETYGNYSLVNYPGLYKPRHLNTFREAGFIAGRRISENKLKEMSFDVDMASFEMFHEPLFPYNLPHLWMKIMKKTRRFKDFDLIDLWKRRLLYSREKKSKDVLNKVKFRLPDKIISNYILR